MVGGIAMIWLKSEYYTIKNDIIILFVINKPLGIKKNIRA